MGKAVQQTQRETHEAEENRGPRTCAGRKEDLPPHFEIGIFPISFRDAARLYCRAWSDKVRWWKWCRRFDWILPTALFFCADWFAMARDSLWDRRCSVPQYLYRYLYKKGGAGKVPSEEARKLICQQSILSVW